MLVLSRRIGEALYIGDDIAVTLVRCGPHSVRLGVTAPRHVHVTRSELVEPPLPAEAADFEVEDEIGGES